MKKIEGNEVSELLRGAGSDFEGEKPKKFRVTVKMKKPWVLVTQWAKKHYKPVEQCCCIGFKAEHLKQIVQVCKDIECTAKKKGEQFRWRIYNSKFRQYTFVLMVFCGGGKEGADLAHKRGLLLTQRYLKELNLLYWVNYKSEMEKHQTGEPVSGYK